MPYASYDAVALLWTPAPRFIQIMSRGNGFQHPQYFWGQSDKLTSLLDQVVADATTFGVHDDCMQAGEILTQLLNESQFFSALTREQLRQLEPDVRAFVDKVQAVDGLAAEWDERIRQKKIQLSSKTVSKKRGRSDDFEDEYAVPVKRHRATCGEEMMMEMEVGSNGSFAIPSPWIQNTSSQPVMWAETFYG